MFEKLKNLFRKKRYPLPANRGFIKWTDEALKYNLPIKKVELYLDGYVYTLPYISETAITILEDNLRVPIVDLTGKKALPKLDLVKVVRPEIIEVSRF